MTKSIFPFIFAYRHSNRSPTSPLQTQNHPPRRAAELTRENDRRPAFRAFLRMAQKTQFSRRLRQHEGSRDAGEDVLFANRPSTG